jgi:ParB-like chromosome segregation protein Spo0J
MTVTEERGDQPQMVGIPETLRPLAVPIDSLQPYHKNARRRAGAIVNDSLRRHGQYRPVVVNRGTLTGRENEILAGNGTWAEAKELGWPYIAATFVDVSEDTAARIVLVDNKSNDEAGYDERLLAELLGSLPDLEGTGFERDELDQLLTNLAEEALSGSEGPADDGEADDEDPDAGTLLALTDVTVAEPKHQPAHGSRWRVGRHLLVVAKLADEHELWRDELPGRIFCPYPEPYLTATTLAQEQSLLLVQPNRYLAGHLLDKHEALFPGTVEKL